MCVPMKNRIRVNMDFMNFYNIKLITNAEFLTTLFFLIRGLKLIVEEAVLSRQF